MPPNLEMITYFLPEGDVHLTVKVTDDQRRILDSNPMFVADASPIAERMEKMRRDFAKSAGRTR
jgi:hypothetical protein